MGSERAPDGSRPARQRGRLLRQRPNAVQRRRRWIGAILVTTDRPVARFLSPPQFPRDRPGRLGRWPDPGERQRGQETRRRGARLADARASTDQGPGKSAFTDPQGIARAAFGADGKTLVTLTRQGRPRRWDLATGTPVEPPCVPEFDFRGGRPFPTSFLSLEVDDRNKASFVYQAPGQAGIPARSQAVLFRWHEVEGEKRLPAVPPGVLASRSLLKTALAPTAGVSVAAYSAPFAPVPSRFLLCRLDLESGKECTVFEGQQSPHWLGQSPDGRWAVLLQTEGQGPALRRTVLVLDVERKIVACARRHSRARCRRFAS